MHILKKLVSTNIVNLYPATYVHTQSIRMLITVGWKNFIVGIKVLFKNFHINFFVFLGSQGKTFNSQ